MPSPFQSVNAPKNCLWRNVYVTGGYSGAPRKNAVPIPRHSGLHTKAPASTRVLKPSSLPTRRGLLSCFLFHKTLKTSHRVYDTFFPASGPWFLLLPLPIINVSFSTGWYCLILLSANVTSSKKPVLITLFQIAPPYPRPHHPLIAFIAVIIICKGLVNILVYLFRICVLYLSISTMRARTLPCHCWIYNIWYLAITFCWASKWTRVLRLVSVTSSEERTLRWHFLRNLICRVRFMLSAFVFRHIHWAILVASGNQNVASWLKNTKCNILSGRNISNHADSIFTISGKQINYN